MAAPQQEAGQADLSLPAIAVGVQVHLLILDRSPEPFNENVVVATLSPRPADLDLLSLQSGHEAGCGELTALAGVEYLWSACASQCHLKSLQTELRVQAVRELPAEHIPGEEIHDRYQVEESFLEGDGGDIGGPHLIHSRDLAGIRQAGKALRGCPWNCGAWFLESRP